MNFCFRTPAEHRCMHATRDEPRPETRLTHGAYWDIITFTSKKAGIAMECYHGEPLTQSRATYALLEGEKVIILSSTLWHSRIGALIIATSASSIGLQIYASVGATILWVLSPATRALSDSRVAGISERLTRPERPSGPFLFAFRYASIICKPVEESSMLYDVCTPPAHQTLSNRANVYSTTQIPFGHPM